MIKLISPPAILRDPHLETPETRETGDPIFSVTLEFASLRDIKPLEDEIAKVMPKNGSSPLRKIATTNGDVWRIKVRRKEAPKVVAADQKESHTSPLRDGDHIRAQMGLVAYDYLGGGVVSHLGNIQFLMHSDHSPVDHLTRPEEKHS